MSSVSSSSYAYQQYVKPVSLPSLNETQKIAMENLTAQLGKTQFKAYTPKNYYDDRHIYAQTWSDEAFQSSTTQNLNKLKQALMGYSTPIQNSIGTYSFSVSDDGIVQNLSPASSGYFHDAKGNPISPEAIAKSIQAADQDQDGLISSLELQNKMQELQQNGDLAGVYLLNDIKTQFDITGPDQFIQLNDKNGSLEIKVYNTSQLKYPVNTASPVTSTAPQSNTPSNLASTVPQTSTVTNTQASSDDNLGIDALKDRGKVLDLLRKTDLNRDGAVSLEEVETYRSSLPDTEENSDDIKLLDSLLNKDKDGISNFIRLHASYGWGSSVPLSKIENASHSWGRFIEIYKTGQTFDPLGELGVVSK